MIRRHSKSGINGFARQIQVLADMPGIQGNYLVGRQSIAPFHPVRDRRPNQGDGRLADKGLSESGLDQLCSDMGPLEFQDQFKFQRQIPIHGRLIPGR